MARSTGSPWNRGRGRSGGSRTPGDVGGGGEGVERRLRLAARGLGRGGQKKKQRGMRDGQSYKKTGAEDNK